jgi:hypothetical protein
MIRAIEPTVNGIVQTIWDVGARPGDPEMMSAGLVPAPSDRIAPGGGASDEDALATSMGGGR